MTGGSRIVAFGSAEDAENSQPPAQDGPLELTEAQEAPVEDDAPAWDEEEARAPRTRGWIAPALAILAIAGWTGFFGWANQAEMLAGGSPQQWIGWITAWSMPVLLVVALLLLAMRLSRREAARFAEAAQSLRLEADALETRLNTVNRELSLAREFLGAQSRELESFGRIAGDKLSRHAETLQELVQTNGAQVDLIASVSNIAMENMGKLRDDLPVIANSARDMSNQIGNAGRTAHGQLAEMIAGFERLNQFGEASERQVTSLRTKVDAALAAFEAQASQLDDIAATRFAALNEKSEAFRTELDTREVEALTALRGRADRLREELAGARDLLESEEEESLKSLQARINAIREGAATVGRAVSDGEKSAIDAWNAQVAQIKADLTGALEEVSRIDEQALANARQRLAELHEEAQRVDETMAERNNAFDEQLAARREAADQFASESSGKLAATLAGIDAELAQRRSEQAEQADALAAHSEAIAARLATLREDIAEVAGQGSDAESKLAAGLAALAAKLEESRGKLDGTGEQIAELTDSSIRLLEIIQSGARHSREDLPEAIGVAESRLSTLSQETEKLGLMMGQAGDKSAELSNYVIAAREAGEAAGQEVEALHARLAEASDAHEQRLGKLAQLLTGLGEESRAISASAQGELRQALESLEQATTGAVAALESSTATGVAALAEKVGSEAAEAIDRAIRFKTTESIAQLEQAAAHSAGVSREAAVQLRDQLAMVNELAGNLETRVQRARERAEEQVDNDFSRRVALITEALNSNAIDIAKALSSEVTDTAWTSYLRGDRGIFTRRAVRLIDNGEAREIAEIYDEDPDFRDHVSRYIHDFEAMLRTMLSTRDGHALGVTLLSSDMGKLYVVLAQAIERLRD